MSQEQHNLEKALNVSYEPKDTEIEKINLIMIFLKQENHLRI